MQIKELKVTVGEVCEGYFNDAEEGVVGYDKRLDIRPKYQREFVYKDAQRDEVIRTVMKGLPLNVMYWCKVKKEDGSEGFEVLDGQQRTISLCEYVDGTFSVDDKYFYNLPADKKQQILDYPLFVYVCDGTDSEKLEWFRIINIAGEELTDQELRNAVYAGSWTSDAKRYFSKTGCAAGTLAGDYLKGASIRQEYLETAIFWAASAEGKTIEAYMAEHQNDPSAVQLWNYFRSVIDWVEAIFPKKRKEMKGLPWGLFYNQHGKRTDLDPKKLETEIQRLMGDEDVTKKSGIYEYLLTGQEKKLSIRSFDRRDALAAYEKQGHIDAARFVMITAAFEWEFDRLFPDGICKSKERVEAELIVSQKLNELIDTSSGKTKKIYKSLLKCIERRPSLANKIEKIGSDMGALLEPFGQQLYGFNKEELNYTDMGKRLGDQRNYFAHGDLDKDFIGLSLLDLIFLQRIIYAIQLKISGLEDKQIQRAINDLFQCRFAI